MRRQFFAATILCCSLLSSSAFTLDFSTHGYYRTRVIANDNLDLQRNNTAIPRTNDRFGFISYNQMRLRLEPTLKINDNLAIHGQLDVLDNLLYGTSNTSELGINVPVIGTLTLPPGAGSFRMTGGEAGENGSLNVRSVWADILTPVGLFRVGRQPSHWGLGIFQHDGRNRQGDFGDTADRIMYLAQYDLEGKGAMSGGLLWDIAYEAQSDPRRSGFTAPPGSNAMDAQQYAAFVLYEQDDLSLGAFGGLRHRDGPEGARTMTVTDAVGNSGIDAGIDGNTNLYFGDLFARYQYGPHQIKLEGVYLGGRVTTGLAANGIAFSGIGAADTSNPCGSGGIICMPSNQPVQVIMAALEASGEYSFGGAWNLKGGFAEGDGDILSQKITQFGFRPGYQVALMMFNMPLGTSPKFFDSSSGNQIAGGVPITGNNINNAVYISAGYKHRFDTQHAIPGTEWIKVGGQATTAWAHKKNININFSSLTGTPNLPTLSENANTLFKRWYGLEFDVSAEAKSFDHLYTMLEAGFLLPGRAYNIDVALTDPGSIVLTIPADKAEIAWMTRLTATIEF
ncbi:MAG: hypothetical protein HY540_03960 [Deltaproteobacteria bacterium]|nr:hypothetical protein [Deltaproteobacteria bacterium]